ncbi:SDR family NAD(P)-dependent oxidoreductase [Clavibacter michiganensis subsp. phaseoli]|uniref:SDR family NAD(P)-dependent oxidoreductase n=1 Tax=Clavibacter phaseoli TaxID=1734031 RepID=A0A8I0S4T7_9MICO|nr:SDR family NAD(P)-dependent oxidoreductase [Clavibacter phaseoli]MBF4630204.1 SDR family NAD(P)-dependent oxidoreductase [Clavibacter phaseoli]
MTGPLDGRTIVITGASSGIGRIAARELHARGADVVVVGRDPERTRGIAAELGARHVLADMDRLAEVRALATTLLETCPRIHVLALNAGSLVPRRATTVDGHETTFQRNVLAPFLLTRLLLPRLDETHAALDADETPVRVIGTASRANLWGRVRLDDLDWRKRPWLGGWQAYGTSKAMMILMMRTLAERVGPRGIEACSFHPGLVRTSFGSDSTVMKALLALSMGAYGISAEAGAVPLVQLASVPDLGAPSGTYFDQLTPDGKTTAQAADRQLGRDLWAALELAAGTDEPPRR